MIKRYLTKFITLCVLAVTVIGSSPIGANAEWKQDSTGWWYADGSAWYTGWKLIDKNWYYFYSNGYMANCDKIDGCFVNSSGVWTNSITADDAIKLIFNEDGNYISKFADDYTKLSYVSSNENMPTGDAWNVPEEPCYILVLYNEQGDYDVCEYLVGKNSKNVYVMWNQGNSSIYQIENNKKIKTFKWIEGGQSYEWR